MNYTIDVIIAGIKRLSSLPIFYTVSLGLLFLVGLSGDGTQAAAQAGGVTDINVGATVKQPSVKRFGINMSGQAFYDSGQMLRNLIQRNPGFEGEMWQSILVCNSANGNSCTDDNPYNQWPANFIQGASVEFIYGAAKGETATVTSMQPASGNSGITVNFSNLNNKPAKGDFYIVRKSFPGNAQAGWWTGSGGGGSISTEFNDLSPNSPGKQALRLTAAGNGQSAGANAYFDTVAGRSFVQLNGSYTLSFRAKGAGGSNQLFVNVGRIGTAHGDVSYLQKTISLSNQWQDYSFSFSASEDGSYVGSAQVGFNVNGASALLDDVALEEQQAPNNPTAYRNAVVNRLLELRPGVLRYMDNGTDFGSSIDNMLAVPFARMRSGYAETQTEEDDIPVGLHEFLVLCQTVGAEPWYTMPAGMSTTEMQHLVQYLSGDASTPYGSIRAKLGQAAPWTSVFPTIHLELGNELWNEVSFSGEKMFDPIAVGQRAGLIFGTAKSTPGYDSSKIDLVLDGWAAVPWWTGQELSVATNADTIDAAPYLFNNLSDYSSNEAIFGPMFAQPEQVDSTPDGYMAQQAQAAAAGKVKLAVYEVNLSAVQGTAPQNTLDGAVASVGAGIAVLDHMFLLLRDDGILTQNMFALPEYENGFLNTNNPNANENLKLWGSVIDMGGQTNLCRPTFLAEQLANTAIFGSLLETIQTGANPTWNQPKSANDSIQLAKAHYLQSFAFSDGNNHSVVVFNLSRTNALPVTFSGANAPHGAVQVGQLTSRNITDTNENQNTVAVTNNSVSGFNSSNATSLPPYSMTVFTWNGAGGSTPVSTSSTLSATPTQASPGQAVKLTATVTAGSQEPDGSVTFLDNGDSLGNASLSNGSASVTITTLAAGSHTISAQYAGDANFGASASPAVTVTVGSAQIGTVTNLSPSATQVATGQNITLNATVAPQSGAAVPTGTVVFSLGNAQVGSAPLKNGSASLPFAAPGTGGTYTLTAAYSGSAAAAASTSSAVTLNVSAPVTVATTTKVGANPTTVVSGQNLTLTAAVSPVAGAAVPFGEVTFYLGKNAVATTALNNGTATLTTTAPQTGTYSLYASYAGNQYTLASNSAPITLSVSQPAPPGSAGGTTTVITAPQQVGLFQPVTINVSVTSQDPKHIPTGTVRLLLGSYPISQLTLTSGTASLTVPAAEPGTYTLRAVYSGDAADTISTSSDVSIVVGGDGSSGVTAGAGSRPGPSSGREDVFEGDDSGAASEEAAPGGMARVTPDSKPSETATYGGLLPLEVR